MIFEVVYDASSIGIGSVFNQDGHHVACFSEKLNEVKQQYPI